VSSTRSLVLRQVNFEFLLAAAVLSDLGSPEVSVVVKPPTLLSTVDAGRASVFLAGSIDLGQAINWQAQIERKLADLRVTVFNPRRDAWDASWPQNASFAPFREQVTWELDALDRADVVALFFADHSKAPISLLEFGLHARSQRLVVYCSDKFYRFGNVQIVCERYGITLFTQQEDWFAAVRERVRAVSLLTPEQRIAARGAVAAAQPRQRPSRLPLAAAAAIVVATAAIALLAWRRRQ
jgi:hypothetical protein